MRILSKTILIFFIFMAISIMPAFSVVLDKDYLESKITEDLNKKYSEKNVDGVVIVKNVPSVNIDFKTSKISIDTVCDFASKSKIKPAKVIFYENKTPVRMIIVPVEVVTYDNVLVATNSIDRGSLLTNANTHFEKRSIPENSVNLIAENFDYSNLISQKTFRAGEVIDKRFLTKQTVVLRSNQVTAIFQTGGIRLSIDVIALENGAIGDYIKVRSNQYNKIYQGKVISPHQILIEI